MVIHSQCMSLLSAFLVPSGAIPPINLVADSFYVLMQLPNFNALFIVSLIAAVTSISYSTIGWVSAVADGKAADVSYAIKGDGTHKLMGIFNALGTCVFAYGGHSVVLEIQVRHQPFHLLGLTALGGVPDPKVSQP